MGCMTRLSVWYFRISHCSDMVFHTMIPSSFELTLWMASFMSS